MIGADQMPARLKTVCDAQVAVYNQGCSITMRNSIPDTLQIPIENPKQWLRIPDVICVFVDMLGSTRLSAESHDASTAGTYQLFTGTAVKLFSEFESPYIDVRGDGVCALFDSDQKYRALAAAVTFKTFADEEFVPCIRKATDIQVGCHVGMDQKTVLVRKLGSKRHRGRTDRQNEVWAGKPVNMAAKLAAKTMHNQMLVSDRYFKTLKDDHALMSCGCPDGERKPLWSKVDLSNDNRFDFDSAYVLKSNWCKTHGQEYCDAIIALDDKD